MKFIDLTGKQFGRLTVLNRTEDGINPNGSKYIRWNCKCECGSTTIVRGQSLKNGHTQSCGCFHKETLGKSSLKENVFVEENDFMIGITPSGEKFYFDPDDFENIKGYCWNVNKQGYVVARDRTGKHSKCLLLHRVVMRVSQKDLVVDHINHNTLDNRKSNLRVCTRSQNMMNTNPSTRSATGVKGVTWDNDRQKWSASIGINNKNIYLGRFDTFEQAISARRRAEEDYQSVYALRAKTRALKNEHPHIFAIDAGSTDSGFCLFDIKTYKPVQFGKISNTELISLIPKINSDYIISYFVVEQFAFYGKNNPIGQTTIEAITWNGKFIREAEILSLNTAYVYRREEKMNLCRTMKCGDKEIRNALIQRFAQHDFKSGKGTKSNPDFFYGFAADAWSAFAVAVTYLDMYVHMKGVL